MKTGKPMGDLGRLRVEPVLDAIKRPGGRRESLPQWTAVYEWYISIE